MIDSSTDARKERFDEDAAWQLVQQAAKVFVAKGKKVTELTPAQDGREECLAKVMGPSGNLRAPTLKIGESLIVGFNTDLYQEQFC